MPRHPDRLQYDDSQRGCEQRKTTCLPGAGQRRRDPFQCARKKGERPYDGMPAKWWRRAPQIPTGYRWNYDQQTSMIWHRERIGSFRICVKNFSYKCLPAWLNQQGHTLKFTSWSLGLIICKSIKAIHWATLTLLAIPLRRLDYPSSPGQTWQDRFVKKEECSQLNCATVIPLFAQLHNCANSGTRVVFNRPLQLWLFENSMV